MVIYAIARRGVNPVVNAISALIVVGFGSLILISERLRDDMNRRYFLMGAAGLAACSRDRRPRLNVFNWSDYIAPDTVPKFEAEFGVRVRYGIYESNEEMLARVMGGNSGWDVVFPTDYIVKPMLANDLLAQVHREELPDLAQLEPRFQQSGMGPGAEMVGSLHGNRCGHRLQPQVESRRPGHGRICGRSGCAAG